MIYNPNTTNGILILQMATNRIILVLFINFNKYYRSILIKTFYSTNNYS